MDIPLALTFDDVLLVPRYSTIPSRFSKEIDISVNIGNHTIEYPIISSNMDSVTEFTMAKKMEDLGGLGIIHRFMNPTKQYEQLQGLNYAIGCIGVGEIERDRYNCIKKVSHAILIDVAHGDHKLVVDQIKYVRDKDPDITIIAGNVATEDGTYHLADAGANIIKVGVGPSQICQTRNKSGNGYPQLSAIMECAKIKSYKHKIKIISDGGAKHPGDFVKAYAAGADFVMSGNFFAGTDEAVGKIYREKGFVYKLYRGLASAAAQEAWKGYVTAVEGELTRVPYKGPVEDIFNEILAGIFSGMSYQNARSLVELRNNAHFIRQTTAGMYETSTHSTR